MQPMTYYVTTDIHVAVTLHRPLGTYETKPTNPRHKHTIHITKGDTNTPNLERTRTQAYSYHELRWKPIQYYYIRNHY